MLEAFKDAPFLNRAITKTDLPNNLGRVLGFQEDPTKLVRVWGLPSSGPDFEYVLDFYTDSSRRWQRFTEKSGIKIPHPLPVFGERSKGSKTCMFYVVVDKVQGTNLLDYTYEDENKSDIDLFGQLFENLAGYAALIYKQGGDYMSDQKLDQYMIGTTSRSKNRGILFVDLDSEHGIYKADNRRDSGNYYFFGFLGKISLMMRILEAKCNGIKFEEARRKFKDFLDNIPADHSYSQIIENLNRTFDMDF